MIGCMDVDFQCSYLGFDRTVMRTHFITGPQSLSCFTAGRAGESVPLQGAPNDQAFLTDVVLVADAKTRA